MRENVFVKNEENSESPFKLATVGTIYDDGISLVMTSTISIHIQDRLVLVTVVLAISR